MPTRKLNPPKLLLELLMILIILCYLIPIWMVVANSLKTSTGAGLMGLGLPAKLEWGNYEYVLQEAKVMLGLFNGVFFGFMTIFFAVLFASMASFYFARIRSRLSTGLYNYFIAGLIVPTAVVPVYLWLRILELTNTYAGIVLLFVTGVLPFSIFLFTGFIKSIPRELDEAAIIDGTNPFQLFFRVLFPLLKPVTITVTIFVFIAVWNNVTTYLYFANSSKFPLPLSVYSFFGKYSQSWNLVFADILIGIVPCLILFMIGQRYMVSGLMAGAVKG